MIDIICKSTSSYAQNIKQFAWVVVFPLCRGESGGIVIALLDVIHFCHNVPFITFNIIPVFSFRTYGRSRFYYSTHGYQLQYEINLAMSTCLPTKIVIMIYIINFLYRWGPYIIMQIKIE